MKRDTGESYTKETMTGFQERMQKKTIFGTILVIISI